MLTKVIRAALALDLFLICSEGVASPDLSYLPLGHSNLAQLGFCLGVAVILIEIGSVTSSFFSSWEPSAKSHDDGGNKSV
jgi:hypothetical protein